MKKESIFAIVALASSVNLPAESSDFIGQEKALSQRLLNSGKRFIDVDQKELKDNQTSVQEVLINKGEFKKAIEHWLVNGSTYSEEQISKIVGKLNKKYKNSELSLKQILEAELVVSDTFLDSVEMTQMFDALEGFNPSRIFDREVNLDEGFRELISDTFLNAKPSDTFTDSQVRASDTFIDGSRISRERMDTFVE